MPMRLIAAGVLLGCAMTLSACEQRSVTGLYIHTTANSVELMQLVADKSDHVTGSIQSIGIDTANRVVGQTTSLAGSVDGDNLTLSTPQRWFANGATFTGLHHGDDIMLSLSTPQGLQTYPFHAGTLDQFTAATIRAAPRLHRQTPPTPRAPICWTRHWGGRKRPINGPTRSISPASVASLKRQNECVFPFALFWLVWRR